MTELVFPLFNPSPAATYLNNSWYPAIDTVERIIVLRKTYGYMNHAAAYNHAKNIIANMNLSIMNEIEELGGIILPLVPVKSE